MERARALGGDGGYAPSRMRGSSRRWGPVQLGPTAAHDVWVMRVSPHRSGSSWARWANI